MASGKHPTSASAELTLVHLKNCLLNLPPSLVSLLVNVNTPVQNVVVELGFKSPTASVFLGWTGMPSKRRAAAPVSRQGIMGSRGATRDQETQLVEIDAALAHALGLSDGQKVTATLHVDPPIAHTVNIEPLTAEDWEMIELHASFLELNLQSQVRALPNPAYAPDGNKPVPPHALTLHLSPTSSANIRVLSIEPALPPDAPFAKMSPNAEVIVAPKMRAKNSHSSGDHRSVASTSKSRRSGGSGARKRGAKEEPTFLRPVDRAACSQWFDDGPVCLDLGVWIDRDLLSKSFRGVSYVVVDVIRPAGLREPQPEGASDPTTAVAPSKVVARLKPWDDAPNGQTAALSSPLCSALGCCGIVGGVVKIQAAPQQLQQGLVQRIRVLPFDVGSKLSEGLRLGGETRAEQEESAGRFRQMYSASSDTQGLLQGPITDGMVVGLFDGLEAPQGWAGAVVEFEYRSDVTLQDKGKDAVSWMTSLDPKMAVDFQQPQPRPSWMASSDQSELQSAGSTLIGIDSLLDSLQTHLSHMSSVLLTGTMGSGKTSVAKQLAKRLRQESLFYTIYFSCRNLAAEESSMSTIKETLGRIFMSAGWGARLGGQALVVLDDLDKLCPAETELEVGNDNGRSRQVSETIRSVTRRFCSGGGVVLLVTAEGKDAMNNVFVSGHLVREIIELRAPDKDARRSVLESLAKQYVIDDGPSSDNSRPPTADGSVFAGDDNHWMHGSEQPRTRSGPDGFVLDPDLDLLDVAGSTDGYMPGDLEVLVSRARNEAIIRSIGESPDQAALRLSQRDFEKARKGFTPASLRNVPLQSSTTTFDSIGGLHETRRMLLETLEYPTKYGPIFAQCPLRLRSGLLLYGYPGCGKTLLASAVAGQCGLNFISVKGPEILNKYIGASEKSVRDLFDRAQAAKPCVLFFDEFDSIAPKRGHDSTGVTDRVVNQLLTQMDGAEGLSGVYVLAATSRPDLIDPALLRPGRLDKSLLCDMPSVHDRVDILASLLHKVRLSGEPSETRTLLTDVANRTTGFSGADLQALVSNAQLEAIHDVLDAATSRGAIGQQQRDAHSPPSSSPSFVQFRYGSGPSAAADDTVPRSASAALIQEAAMASKLEHIRLARKRAKQARTGPDTAASANKDEGQQADVVIEWRHLNKALEKTRASISADERRRLQRIYLEFVEGRSGQLKDGQGSMEIGGRSSLM
ncbi:hypothetical protein XA68_13975 [Ophiocordyceps unilateralis]|uniref:Peroxisomal ATPase PEX1 n=1 Tax=Ophiocordyceps unilateralis TaxID=268505 RepID=A0A2A9PAD3_OPHUN|nr:hypothetical protein XA68_13975 [Ophiocordyceps unilateralis]